MSFVYDIGWNVSSVVVTIAVFLFTFFAVAIAVSIRDMGTIAIAILAIAVTSAAVWADISLYVQYQNHYRVLYATETHNIQIITGQKVMGFSDNGTDDNFPDVRDVQALLANGKTENFYYNPTTGSMIEAKN